MEERDVFSSIVPVIELSPYAPQDPRWIAKMKQIAEDVLTTESFRLGKNETVEKLPSLRIFEEKKHNKSLPYAPVLEVPSPASKGKGPSTSASPPSADDPNLVNIQWVPTMVVVLSAIGHALSTGLDTGDVISVDTVWEYIEKSERKVKFMGPIDEIVFADNLDAQPERHPDQAYWMHRHASSLGKDDQLTFVVANAVREAWTEYHTWLRKSFQSRLAQTNRVDEDLRHGLLPLPTEGQKTNYGHDLQAYQLRLAMRNRGGNFASAPDVSGTKELVNLIAQLEERARLRDEAFLSAISDLSKKTKEDRPVDVTRIKYYGEKFKDSDNPFRWFRRWAQRAVSAKIDTVESMLAWLPQALDPAKAPIATHWAHSIESTGVPESLEELRESFIFAVTDEKSRSPTTLYNKLISMVWEPTKEGVKPYSMDFESAYQDLLDANQIDPHRRFEPTSQSVASAYWSSLNIADIRALTKDIDEYAPLKEVIKETLKLMDKTYDRGDPTMSNAVVSETVEKKDSRRGGATSTTKVTSVTETSPRSTPGFGIFGQNQRRFSNSRSSFVPTSPLKSALKTTNVSTSSPIGGNAANVKVTSATKTLSSNTSTPSNIDSEIEAVTKKLENLKLAKTGIAQGYNKANVTCYRCGEKGHYARECASDSIRPEAHGYLVLAHDLQSDVEPAGEEYEDYDESHEALYRQASKMFLMAYLDTDEADEAEEKEPSVSKQDFP